MVMPNDPPPPVPRDAAERGMRHWTVIVVGAAILIIVFLISR
jgi:uncharacterized integral membrane protein